MGLWAAFGWGRFITKDTKGHEGHDGAGGPVREAQEVGWRARAREGRLVPPRLSSSSGERSETGGPSGAEGDLFRQADLSSELPTGSRSRAPLGPPVCAAKPRLAGG